MKRIGYIRFGNIKEKRRSLVSECGVEDSDDRIVVEEPERKRPTGDWQKDYPRRAFVISILREGQVLAITNFEELGKTESEVLMMLALISEKGAKLAVGTADNLFVLPKETACQVAELTGKLKQHFNTLRTAPARKRRNKTRSDVYLEGLKKKYPDVFAEVEAIWGNPKYSNKSAGDAIGAILPDRDKIGWTTVRNFLGNKTDFEEEYTLRSADDT